MITTKPRDLDVKKRHDRKNLLQKKKQHSQNKPKRVAKLIYQPYHKENFDMVQPIDMQQLATIPSTRPSNLSKNTLDSTHYSQLTENHKTLEEPNHRSLPPIPCFDIIKRGNLPYISIWHDKVDVIYTNDFPTVACC